MAKTTIVDLRGQIDSISAEIKSLLDEAATAKAKISEKWRDPDEKLIGKVASLTLRVEGATLDKEALEAKLQEAITEEKFIQYKAAVEEHKRRELLVKERKANLKEAQKLLNEAERAYKSQIGDYTNLGRELVSRGMDESTLYDARQDAVAKADSTYKKKVHHSKM